MLLGIFGKTTNLPCNAFFDINKIRFSKMITTMICCNGFHLQAPRITLEIVPMCHKVFIKS